MNKAEVAARQRIALEHPCARAADTGDARFFQIVRRGRALFSSVLSVNK